MLKYDKKFIDYFIDVVIFVIWIENPNYNQLKSHESELNWSRILKWELANQAKLKKIIHLNLIFVGKYDEIMAWLFTVFPFLSIPIWSSQKRQKTMTSLK